jgi:hypothetical protein
LLKRGYAPFLTFLHCCAHRVNLVGRALESNALFQSLSSLVSGTYVYFHGSGKRTHAYKLAQLAHKTAGYALKNPHEVRWLSITGALAAWRGELPASLHVLAAGSQQGVTDACKLIYDFTEFRVLLAAFLFQPLLDQLQFLVKEFQKQSIFFGDVTHALQQVDATLSEAYGPGVLDTLAVVPPAGHLDAAAAWEPNSDPGALPRTAQPSPQCPRCPDR